MYKYKDDICVIPDEIKRMSEEELKTEIARIEQNSTPKRNGDGKRTVRRF